MFSNLLFLILILLLVSIQPEENSAAWPYSADFAFLIGMSLYIFTLALIWMQNRLFSFSLRRHKGEFLILANLELILFLCVYQLILGAPRIFQEIPYLGGFQIIPVIFSLLLYFGGLAAYHYTSSVHRPSENKNNLYHSLDYSLIQLRMIIPFTLPFLIFTFLVDILSLYPNKELQEILQNQATTPWGYTILFGFTLVFMVLMMIFLPFFIQSIWKCKPLPESELNKQLELLCQKARFKHGGMKIWTIMDESLTAAIIGIVPRFRYVMFTSRLLREFPPCSIEAILAHEIGHSYRKHLLIYPFIIFGMMICIGLFSLYFSADIAQLIAELDLAYPSPLWQLINPLVFFAFYAIIIALYFRFIFGFFSRLFERQADLHVYQLNVDPRQMINALDHVGTATGNSHRVPSWHHYSIQERIDFLESTLVHPELVLRHHRRVNFWLAVYLTAMIASSWYLMLS